MKALKFGNVALCDFVARGHANKFNLVNVISGDAIVGELPADVAFGIYVEMLAQPGQGSDFTLEVVLDGNTLVTLNGKGSMAEGKPGTIGIPVVPMHLDNDAVLEVFVSVSGFKRTRALSRKIFKGVLPPSAF